MAPRGARRYVAPPLRLVQAAVQCSSSHIGDPFTVITFMVQLPVALPKVQLRHRFEPVRRFSMKLLSYDSHK